MYFYKSVYNGYQKLIEQDSERIKVIDATQSIQKIHQNIIYYLEKIFF